MGKYGDALDSIDPLGRQNRIKRGLERALREERAAKRVASSAVDGAMVWNPNAARIANPATISHDTVTQIASWTDVESDGITVQSDRVVVVHPGVYYISAALRYATNTTGRRSVRIHVNGAEEQVFAVSADTLNTYVSTAVELRLAVGDEVTVHTHQSSGAGLNIVDDGSGGPVTAGNRFSMHRISI